MSSDIRGEGLNQDILYAHKDTDYSDHPHHPPSINKCIAQYQFLSSDPSQLSFEAGDIIAVTSEVDEHWVLGRLIDSSESSPARFVPRGYICELEDEENPNGKDWQNEEYFGSYSTLRLPLVLSQPAKSEFIAGLHREMLMDAPRTLAYQRAITLNANCFRGRRVLDIGSGSGILAIFAARAGAARVYAVEGSSMAKHTRAVVSQNGLDDVIEVMEGRIEEIELPSPVDVIISEWMGTMLLFEFMLDSVIQGRNRWLEPGGLIFPSHASLHIALATAQDTLQGHVDMWRNQYGVDMSPLVPVAMSEFFGRPVYNHVFSQNDILSDSACIYQISVGSVTGDSLEEVRSDFSLKANKSGRMHGFGAWFDVSFFGGDAGDGEHEDMNNEGMVVLSTSPFSPLTHWKHTLLMMDKAIELQAGDLIQGTIRLERNRVYRRHLRVHIVCTHHETKLEKTFLLWR